jgi:hypothetical protein
MSYIHIRLYPASNLGSIRKLSIDSDTVGIPLHLKKR